MTKEEKKLELYGIEPNCEPNCYESDREEQWHQCGLHEGFDDGYNFAIEVACEWLEEALMFGCHPCNGHARVLEFRKAMEGGEE